MLLIRFFPGTFLSTLSLRRATIFLTICQERQGISIHALLAESDAADISARRGASISIHALLAESDLTSEVSDNVPLAISIHALLAESDKPSIHVQHPLKSISIHALLAESDNGHGQALHKA